MPYFGASRGAVAQSVTVYACGCLWVRSPLEEMKYLLKFLRSDVELNLTRRLRESGERRFLTLVSLCLPCCVRNAALSYIIL